MCIFNIMKYDICVVSFSDIRFDGRTKNLIDALLYLEKKVIVISLTPINIFDDAVTHITIKTSLQRRVLFRWIAFYNEVKKCLKHIDYQIYWASDLYSLPNGRDKLIYDSREIYSALSSLHNSSFRQKVLTAIEKKYIQKTNVIITSGTRDSNYIKNKYQLKSPIYEIYNYPLYQEHINSNTIKQQLNIAENKIILLYQGVLLQGRGIIPIIDAIKEHSQYVLVILGEGGYKDTLKNYVDVLNMKDRVHFVGNIEYKELHQWTCSADIGLCNIEPISYSYQLALPNKLFEYILAELPVIATDLPALRDILYKKENNHLGIIIPADNKQNDIINALNNLVLSKNYYKENIRNAKHNYTYQQQYHLIKDILSAPELNSA